jgi:hypothetical protein
MKPIIVGWEKLPGNASVICAAPRNFAHAIAPQDPDARATRRYAVPRDRCCGGALPTLQIAASGLHCVAGATSRSFALI